jgi:hypothetical protein
MDFTFKVVCSKLSYNFTVRECAQIHLNGHNTGRCSFSVQNINCCDGPLGAPCILGSLCLEYSWYVGTLLIADLHYSPTGLFLDAFAKLRKATNRFYMSVCTSVRMEQRRSHWSDFHEIRHLSILRKSVKKIQASLKSDKNSGNYVHLWKYHAGFFLEWEMFQTKVVQKIKPHILCSIIFFSRISFRLWDNVGKYARVGQATDDNMAHEHCTLDN